MKNEDQIIAGIEELSTQITEIKKQVSKLTLPNSNEESSNTFKKVEDITMQNLHLLKSYSQHFSELSHLKNDLQNKELIRRNEVVHNYLEIKNGKNWLIGFVLYFLCSLILSFFLINQNSNYKQQLIRSHNNDVKYRFLKVHGEPLSNFKSVAKNTTELTYYIDSHFKSKPQEVEEYVQKREEQIRLAFEAAEIAKQKEAEAKSAKEKAVKLQDQLK